MTKFPRRAVAICATMFVAAVAAGSAEARSTTAFGSFKVQNPPGVPNVDNQYSCLTEDNGAVVNRCSAPVNLVFDMPIDNSGTHAITVQDWWQWGSGSTAFSCTAYSYTGTGTGTQGTTQWFTGASENRALSVPNGNGGSIAVICWGVPVGDGVANINWSY